MEVGQGYAIQILVAHYLGIDVSHVDTAITYLNKGSIPPSMMLTFEQQARKAVKEINMNGLKKEAEESIDKALEKVGLENEIETNKG